MEITQKIVELVTAKLLDEKKIRVSSAVLLIVPEESLETQIARTLEILKKTVHTSKTFPINHLILIKTGDAEHYIVLNLHFTDPLNCQAFCIDFSHALVSIDFENLIRQKFPFANVKKFSLYQIPPEIDLSLHSTYLTKKIEDFFSSPQSNELEKPFPSSLELRELNLTYKEYTQGKIEEKYKLVPFKQVLKSTFTSSAAIWLATTALTLSVFVNIALYGRHSESTLNASVLVLKVDSLWRP